MEKIGVLALGQTPRPDFECIFRRHLPNAALRVQGALDGLSHQAIEALSAEGGDYPLFCILADGTSREISLERIKPLLDDRAREVAADGAALSVVMCAGDFPDLESPIPVIYPSRMLTAVVRAICRGANIGVVTPNAGQVPAATQHWRAKGFEPTVAVASPLDHDALPRAAATLSGANPELIVLDCMGFPPAEAQRMRRLAGRPVLCPQGLIPRIVAEILGV